MNDGVLCAFQTFVCAFNQLCTALDQHLNSDIIRNQVFFNDLTNEIKVRLARCRESDFNFLEAHVDKSFEHAHFALWVHWVNQSLVTVAQVNTAPQRCFCDGCIRPGAISEDHRNERRVLGESHLFWCHILWRHCGVLG